MAAPTQEICAPVSVMIPEDVPAQDVLGDVDFRDEFVALADSLQWKEHALGHGEYDTGAAAKTVIANLGCDACKLSGVCFAGQALQTKQETGQTETALDRNALMLASSPRWLAAARVSRSGADPVGLYNATRDRDTTRQALADGTLDAEKLLAGVFNETEGLVSKGDLPELQNLKGIDPAKKVEMQRLVTANGDTFFVTDVSDILTFKVEPLGKAEYSILTAKLLERMLQPGGDGRPQVMSPDDKMQKILHTKPGTRLEELRMSGKNRMYLTITPQEDGSTRIVIVGDHGGDAAAQTAFLSKLGATS